MTESFGLPQQPAGGGSSPAGLIYDFGGGTFKVLSQIWVYEAMTTVSREMPCSLPICIMFALASTLLSPLQSCLFFSSLDRRKRVENGGTRGNRRDTGKTDSIQASAEQWGNGVKAVAVAVTIPSSVGGHWTKPAVLDVERFGVLFFWTSITGHPYPKRIRGLPSCYLHLGTPFKGKQRQRGGIA